MIVYFANRNQEVMGQASTSLPQGLIIVDDVRTEDIESGVASFDVTITYKPEDRLSLEQMTEAGNYVFKSEDDGAECYTIIDAETDTKAKERHLYCEDAGLELLNVTAPAFEAESAHNIAWYINHFAGSSDFEVGNNEIPSATMQLYWDGEQTGTERLRDIASKFGAEISYRFVIENMKITARYVDIYIKRGVDNGQQLRLDRDIDNIVVKHSVANLITAVFPQGNTLDGEDEPLDLIGASAYDDGDIYLDTTTGILYSRKGLGRWARPNGGHIKGKWSYDTDVQETLKARAIEHLKQFSDVAVNYEVDIVRGLENTHIGDRVNVVDDLGEVYVSGRLLKLETSVTRNEKKATLGEYLIRTSGISERVTELAMQVNSTASQTQNIANSLSIISETVDNTFNLEIESILGVETAILKAHLYHGNKDVTQEHSEALYKWIRRTEEGEHLISRGYSIEVNLADLGYAGTILCRFIRPELYDLTDHNLIPITNAAGEAIQVSYAGIYSQPVVNRASKLKALNKASATRTVLTSTPQETGYPVLAREVNLYEKEGLTKRLDPIVQHFWTDDDGAHITEKSQEEFKRDPDNGGGNLLARSDGVRIRDGSRDVATFTDFGVELLSNGETSAEFTPNGATFYGSTDFVIDAANSRIDVNHVEGNENDNASIFLYHSGIGVGSYYADGVQINIGDDSALQVEEMLASALITPNGSVEVTSWRFPDGNHCAVDLKAGSNHFSFGSDEKKATLNGTVSLAISTTNHGLYSEITEPPSWLVKCTDSLVGMPLITRAATTSAANVHVDGAGWLRQSSSSSERYKKDIKDLGGDLDAEKLYDARVVQFKYREDYLGSDDQRYGQDICGFIVEELERVYPIAIEYKDELPEDWNVRYMVPPMLKLIQDQKKEIDELRERIEKLEGK